MFFFFNLKASYICEKLDEVIKEFNIKDKIHIGISDNAANMNAAMRIGEFESLGCVAHTIQLVIHDSLNKQLNTKELITKCRSIVGHFKRSEQASRHFKELQEKCSLPKHQLIQDVETRWNSTYLMMQRFLEQKNAIILYGMRKSSIKSLTPEEWDNIQEMVNLLECFYEATLDISGDKTPISIVIPLFEMLKSKLDDYESESELKTALQKNLNKRLKLIETKSFLGVATLLDPRFKSKYLSEDQLEKSKMEIETFFDENPVMVVNSILVQKDNHAGKPKKKKNRKNQIKGSSIWEKHDSVPHIEVQEEDESVLNKEINLYINEPLSPRSINVFEYWNSSPFKSLKAVAIKYLSAPPTSVASEQLFSAAGQLYTDRRSNLQGINAEKLLFCHYNIQLFDFKY